MGWVKEMMKGLGSKKRKKVNGKRKGKLGKEEKNLRVSDNYRFST